MVTNPETKSVEKYTLWHDLLTLLWSGGAMRIVGSLPTVFRSGSPTLQLLVRMWKVGTV